MLCLFRNLDRMALSKLTYRETTCKRKIKKFYIYFFTLIYKILLVFTQTHTLQKGYEKNKDVYLFSKTGGKKKIAFILRRMLMVFFWFCRFFFYKHNPWLHCRLSEMMVFSNSERSEKSVDKNVFLSYQQNDSSNTDIDYSGWLLNNFR